MFKKDLQALRLTFVYLVYCLKVFLKVLFYKQKKAKSLVYIKN